MFVQPTSATRRSSRRGPRRGPGAALHSLTLPTALVLLALLSLLYAPAMAQPVLDKFESGVVRQINPSETDPQYRDLWSQYPGPCSSTSTLDCLGIVSVTSTTAHDGTYALQDHVTQGNAYVQFYTYSDAKAGWGWMHDFLASGTWQANTYTRLRFWVKVPQGITKAPVGEHNLEIGTFERALRYGDYAGLEDGGGHWYHFFNIPYTGEWHQVIVDTHPNHQRGGSGSTEWGDQLHVTGESQWNYFDAMTRFYIDFYNNGYVLPRVPADFYFDGFELYQAPATENVAQIYSLNGVYVPASKTLSVGWMTRKNESVLYDVRYAFQDIAPLGWTAATPAPGGTGLPSPGDAYNGMEYQTTGISVSGHTSIFLAIKPQNSSLWRQIELPLGATSAAAVCDIQLNKTSFITGDQVIAKVQVKNPGTVAVPVEVKIWVALPPPAAPAPFIRLGADGSLVLDAGFDTGLVPLVQFPVAGLTKGSYEFNCRLLHPVTGALLAEDLNPFAIQ